MYVPDAAIIRTISATGTGANLIASDLLVGSFIDLLIPKLVAARLGCATITGCKGDISIGKALTGSTNYWVATDGDVTASTPTFGLVTGAPKTAGARVLIGRSMLKQSSLSAEALVQRDLVAKIAEAIDAIPGGSRGR